MLYQSLQDYDDEVYHLIEEEKNRQRVGLEMIASENFTSQSVLEALGTCLTNKYSEGYPGKRYYGGNEVIDKIEVLCQKRALEAFGLDDKKWGVNVQAYSGSPANFAVYSALLNPHDRFMGLDLPSGGHLTHGYMNEKKRVSCTSLFWESMGYRVDTNTGWIDYDKVEEMTRYFRPKLIVMGASAYVREWDYIRMKEIADKAGAILMADIAHIAGLVVAGVAKSPFEYCDIVTTTTHKTLRGPRGALIFYRIGVKEVKIENEKEITIMYEYDTKINFTVFPGLQGGPHNNVIAAMAVALKQVCTEEFKQYARDVVDNAKSLAQLLMDKGYHIVTNGTDNHIILWDLKPLGITGSKMEFVYENISISVNKNTCYGDENAIATRGIRIGTPAITTRGIKVQHMPTIADFFDRALKIALDIQKKMKGKTLTEFKAIVLESEELKSLRKEVESFASQFPLPGDNSTYHFLKDK